MKYNYGFMSMNLLTYSLQTLFDQLGSHWTLCSKQEIPHETLKYIHYFYYFFFSSLIIIKIQLEKSPRSQCSNSSSYR